MVGPVRQPRAYLRAVRLTEDEWWDAITFLTRGGHITDDKRKDFVPDHAYLRARRRATGLRRRRRSQGIPVKDFERWLAGTPTPDGRVVDEAWLTVRFDIVLAPATEHIYASPGRCV